jgi:3-methyladenine DNA glycosylase/8-oxoguanine DNA glycosylase
MVTPAHYDFARTVGSLPMSRHDPCYRIADGAFWWATRTPDGAATLSLRRDLVSARSERGERGEPRSANNGVLVATGYGPGAAWVLERADAVAGLRDDLTGFAELAATHPVVAQLAHVHGGLRLPATGVVFPRLLRAVFEQKVTGPEAYRAYTATVRHFHRSLGGETAPGPISGLLLPPPAAAVAATPYHVFHPFGVEQRRADALCRVAGVADRLEECPDAASLTARLTSITGIGPWTAAEVCRTVFGDPDVVSVGDYHIPHMVSWALAGQARAGARDAGPDARKGALSPADRRMLELLEPFRGHRGRVCTLLEIGGYGAPRFGPRMQIRSFAGF